MSDSLSTTSRDFHERTKMKLFYSIVLGALGCLFLGLCSASGGISKFNAETMEVKNMPYDDEIFQSKVSGYGFASFCFIVMACLSFAAAIYTSPILCGSKNEKQTLRSPLEISGEENYNNSSRSNSFAASGATYIDGGAYKSPSYVAGPSPSAPVVAQPYDESYSNNKV